MLIKNKNKLASKLLSKSNEENTEASKESTTYIFDLMALMRVVMAIPEIFEDLALKLILIFLLLKDIYELTWLQTAISKISSKL